MSEQGDAGRQDRDTGGDAEAAGSIEEREAVARADGDDTLGREGEEPSGGAEPGRATTEEPPS